MSDEAATTEPEAKTYGANRATVYTPEAPPEANDGPPPWEREPDPEPEAKEPEPKDEETPEPEEQEAKEPEADEPEEGEPEAKEPETPEPEEQKTPEPEDDARRVRPDARTRREIKFNEQRAERALEERDTAREDLERMRQRFAKLSENPHEAEELKQKFEEEDKEIEAKREAAAKAPRVHRPTDDDRAWLEMAAQEEGVRESAAQAFVSELTAEEPKLVSAVRGLEFPVLMVEELAKMQREDPRTYRDVLSGSVTDVRRKLQAVEARAQKKEEKSTTEEAGSGGGEKEKAETKTEEKREAKAPKEAVDKPVDAKTTPPPAPEEKHPGAYTDERGTVWVSMPKKFKSWDMFTSQRPKA